MKHMKSLMEKVRKGQGGFTLIELLIVIAILGVIAAVVAFNVGGFMRTGGKQAAMMEKDTVQGAIMAAMADNGASQLSSDAQMVGPEADNGTATVSVLIAGAATGVELGPVVTSGQPYITGAIQGEWTLDLYGGIASGSWPSPTAQWTYARATGWTEAAEG